MPLLMAVAGIAGVFFAGRQQGIDIAKRDCSAQKLAANMQAFEQLVAWQKKQGRFLLQSTEKKNAQTAQTHKIVEYVERVVEKPVPSQRHCRFSADGLRFVNRRAACYNRALSDISGVAGPAAEHAAFSCDAAAPE